MLISTLDYFRALNLEGPGNGHGGHIVKVVDMPDGGVTISADVEITFAPEAEPVALPPRILSI